MKIENFPEDIKPDLIPAPSGKLAYACLGCGERFGIDQLLYTCPRCGSVLLIEDLEAGRLKDKGGAHWRKIFDYRRMLNLPALAGVFLYYEFLAPAIPLEDIIYLGEGHTPVVRANARLENLVGCEFYYKNDGLNPSASFKDRGMAAAVSYLNHILKRRDSAEILSICASTGDTSAAAALYASYLSKGLKSAVLLPHGKVTPQQLGQPLGSGANVIELPGVFDDCMKVVEHLAENFDVALLNSKNSWRVLGQESYSYEIASAFDYEIEDLSLFVPIGNAGNITAVLRGLLKFLEAGIIDGLPRVFGVQSEHADPVFRYYAQPPEKRRYAPVTVRPSVAQAAMIGNPVSMPRVLKLVEDYEKKAGRPRFHVVQVTEQEIMDSMLTANRNGHIACTQGGESLAGLRAALAQGLLTPSARAVLDSTAHALKFQEFQNTYFEDNFSPEVGVRARPELINKPVYLRPDSVRLPEPGARLTGEEMNEYIEAASREIAARLGLKPKKA